MNYSRMSECMHKIVGSLTYTTTSATSYIEHAVNSTSRHMQSFIIERELYLLRTPQAHCLRLSGSPALIEYTTQQIFYNATVINKGLSTMLPFWLDVDACWRMEETAQLRLKYKGGDSVNDSTAYCNADWAGDTINKRSSTGYSNCVFINSTSGQQLMSVCGYVKGVKWIHQLLTQVHIKVKTPAVIYADNHVNYQDL
jgi:hypothetical protein